MKPRIFIFILVVLAQIGVPASMIWQHRETLKSGRVWKFRTAPVDPVDAFRGRYVALRFAQEQFPRDSMLHYAGRIYLTLRSDADGFAQIDQAGTDPREGDDIIVAEPAGYDDRTKRQHVRFPFDRFWMEETIAPAAERAYAENSKRDSGTAYATVRVRKGHAALEQLYIHDQPIAEYLRAQAAR